MKLCNFRAEASF